LTAMPSHWPNAVMRLQHDIGVIEFTGNPEKIIRSLLNLIESASVDIEDRQIGDGRRKVFRALEPACNPGAAFDDFFRLRCGPSVNTHQGWAELRQYRQLGVQTLAGFRPGFEQRQGVTEVFDCFTVGGATHSPFARLAPIGHCLQRPAAPLEMMSNDFWRSCCIFTPCSQKGVGNSPVQKLTLRAQ
jgi:hypothetical protein